MALAEDRVATPGTPTIKVSGTNFDWSDRFWNGRVHDYYKTPLY